MLSPRASTLGILLLTTCLIACVSGAAHLLNGSPSPSHRLLARERPSQLSTRPICMWYSARGRTPSGEVRHFYRVTIFVSIPESECTSQLINKVDDLEELYPKNSVYHILAPSWNPNPRYDKRFGRCLLRAQARALGIWVNAAMCQIGEILDYGECVSWLLLL